MDVFMDVISEISDHSDMIRSLLVVSFHPFANICLSIFGSSCQVGMKIKTYLKKTTTERILGKSYPHSMAIEGAIANEFTKEPREVLR